jgi:hypothetical protein
MDYQRYWQEVKMLGEGAGNGNNTDFWHDQWVSG